MNPERKEKERSEEMQYGSDFHKLLFEPKRFYSECTIIGSDGWETEDKKKLIGYNEHFSMK